MSDVVIVRSRILNPDFDRVVVGRFYEPLLGRDYVSPGWTEIRFRVDDTRRRSLVSRLEREFPRFKIQYGAGGIEE